MDRSLIKQLNVTYVHRRIGHHAKHSGYSILFETMELPIASSKFMEKLFKFLPASVKWRLNRFRPQPVGDEGLLPELSALPITRSKKPGICHFIYGEDTYFYTPLWQHANKKIIATYHYPPQRLNERVSRAVLKGLSGVIVVSNSQREWFERYLPPEKIFVINHHVDTEFFHPKGETPQTEPWRIVSVGGILRDMDLLLKVVEGLNTQLGSENIQFDFLIQKKFREPFKQFDNVNFYSRISDEALRGLYQNATLGFMPLIDCTANNAVLEMMACGKPIICSAVGGISDYLNHQGARLFPADIAVEELLEIIVGLLNDNEKRAEMGGHNRSRAEAEFSIPETTEKLLLAYKKIMDGENG